MISMTGSIPFASIFKITRRIDAMPKDAYHVIWNVRINSRELMDHNGKGRQPRPVNFIM